MINTMKTAFLMSLLVALAILIGYALGGMTGLIIGGAIALVGNLFSYWFSDKIVLATYRAQELSEEEAPKLHAMVERLTQRAGLPKPRVYLVPSQTPNAFATGRSPRTASIAVTAGLLGRLNRDELQGVVAHEMSHILHRDILYVMLAGVMLGGVVLLSQVFLRGMFYGVRGSHRRYSSGRRGGGQAQIAIVVIAIVAAVLAPIMAQLLYFAVSRRREYLADAGAARLTRYPEGLAGALEKIAGDPAPQLATANDATAPMYIVNPFKKRGKMDLSAWTSTHPPIAERIRILRSMSQGASYKDYAEAFAGVSRGRNPVPVAAITKEQVPIRPAPAEAGAPEHIQKQLRQVGDIMRKVNGFQFLTCVCGLKIKVPPNFKAPALNCPRCGRTLPLTVQQGQISAAG